MSDGEAVERVLDVLAPWHDFGGESKERCPIFEWGHETTPTDADMRELAERLVAAVKADGGEQR